MRDILLQLKEAGVTIFINSHLLSEIEMLCDRVAILHRGRMVRTGSKQELISKGEIIELCVEGINDLMLQKIRALSTQMKVEGDTIQLNPRDTKTITALPALIIEHGGRLLSLTTHIESLEDIFYRLIKEEENTHE